MVSRLITGFSRDIVDIILHILIRILSENEKNRGYFKDVEEFEDQRNLLGGLLLLKGLDNISSGNEEYSDKLKTYSNGLVWGHSLCEDYYHANKDFDKFNKELSTSLHQRILVKDTISLEPNITLVR